MWAKEQAVGTDKRSWAIPDTAAGCLADISRWIVGHPSCCLIRLFLVAVTPANAFHPVIYSESVMD